MLHTQNRTSLVKLCITGRALRALQLQRLRCDGLLVSQEGQVVHNRCVTVMAGLVSCALHCITLHRIAQLIIDIALPCPVH